MSHRIAGRTRLAALLAVSIASPLLAQPAGTMPPGPPPTAQPTTPPPGAAAAAPAAAPAFTSFVKRDDKGKVVPIGGNPDAHAIVAQASITAERRAALKPVMAEWAADMNRLVIDHLDLIDRLEVDGIVDRLDIDDNAQMILVGKVLAPFSALGSLTDRLSKQGVLAGSELSAVQQASAEYSNAIFNEVMSAPGPENLSPVEAQRVQLLGIARFGFMIGYRDAWSQWHNILSDAAPMLSELAPTDAPEGFKAAAAKAQSAEGADRIAAAKAAVRTLPIEQRRGLLIKAVERGAGSDVAKPVAYVPHPYLR